MALCPLMNGSPIESFDLAEWVTHYTGRIKHNLTNSSIKPPFLKDMGITVDYDEFQRNRNSCKGKFKATLAETFDVPESNVLVTCSGSEALFLAMGSLLKPGDEAIVTTPNYAPLFQIPKLLRADVNFVASKFEDKLQPNIASLRSAVTSRTRLIIITNPNNPSGCAMKRELLDEVVSLGRESVVIVDEAFREFGFQSAPPVAATLSNNCLSLGTMSKFYGAEDLRIGWIIGNEKFIERARKLKNWITIDNSIFSEMLADRIFEKHSTFVKRAKEFYEENVKLVEDWMRTRNDLSWVKPDCGLICFPKFNLPIGSVELAKRLAIEHGVAVGPGAFFNYEGHFRLCFTRSREELSDALTALGNGLDSVTEHTA
jgi:aspartate/methionine/tyrosine aminotransferase